MPARRSVRPGRDQGGFAHIDRRAVSPPNNIPPGVAAKGHLRGSESILARPAGACRVFKNGWPSRAASPNYELLRTFISTVAIGMIAHRQGGIAILKRSPTFYHGQRRRERWRSLGRSDISRGRTSRWVYNGHRSIDMGETLKRPASPSLISGRGSNMAGA